MLNDSTLFRPGKAKSYNFYKCQTDGKGFFWLPPRLGRVRLDVCFVNGKHAVFLDQYGNVKEALLK
jgi:hypothetical protein